VALPIAARSDYAGHPAGKDEDGMAASRLSRRNAAMLLVVGLAAGCSGGRVWPFGGGGGRAVPASQTRADAAIVGGVPVAADGTALLPAVRVVAAERGRQGVILRAEAVAPTQGFFAPELLPVGRGPDGVEVVELRARPPQEPQPIGQERTRTLSIGRFYSNREMRDIRSFRVVAAENAATAVAP
jgi:hypothetical protein